MLLIGSGLLIASFRNLLAVNPGFESNGVITAGVVIPVTSYPEVSDVRAFADRALTAIRNVPGVVNAGATTIVPLSGNHSDSVILAEGYEMQPGESLVSPMQVVVTPGYFEAMSTPLVRGRFFTESDDETSPGAVIVDERLARKFWPGVDPIGRRMYQPSDPQDLLAVNENTRWLTVVGVVREVQLDDLAGRPDSVGAYYFPAKQQVRRNLVFAIKAAIDPNAVMRSVRAAMTEIDPSMPLATVRTMDGLHIDVAPAAPNGDDPRDLVRDRGAVARGHRHVWRVGLPCRPAHARDRRALSARQHDARNRCASCCGKGPCSCYPGSRSGSSAH